MVVHAKMLRAKGYSFLGCTEGQVRLVGGSSSNEGTIEICHNKLWGLITDAGWDNEDAVVICRQLNLPIESKNSLTWCNTTLQTRGLIGNFIIF